jgi:hypothetical protein
MSKLCVPCTLVGVAVKHQQSKLLRVLGWEAAFAAEDNVDDVLGILVSLGPRLVSLLLVLVLPLVVLIRERGALRDLRRLMHWKSVCLDFGCIRHCLCKIFSN